jgi:hypothetical protein
VTQRVTPNAATCTNCGGPISVTSKYGLCARNPECKRLAATARSTGARGNFDINDDVVYDARKPGVVIPVKPPAVDCIIWGCTRPRTMRVYCRHHYDELCGKGQGKKIPKLVTVKAHNRRAPDGVWHFHPEAKRIRYVVDPKTIKRELVPWKGRKKPVCSTKDCTRESLTRGLCNACYKRAWRQARSAPSKLGRKRTPAGKMEERFAYAHSNTA